MPDKPNNGFSFSFLLVCAMGVFFVSCTTDKKKTVYDPIYKGDYRTALTQCKTLAETDDHDAENCLGVIYLLGLGIPIDYPKARFWFMRAAEAGNAFAQRNLGIMHGQGIGTPQDMEASYLWLYAAFKNGNPRAEASLLQITGDTGTNKMMELQKRASAYIKAQSTNTEYN